MQRENYYILLDLSIDPPENDPDVIETAILQKKAEWSRLRNHPSKGLQVQKFINMIPDIQQVMHDEALRKQEAAAAVEVLEEGKESKISEIDSHIDILMGKGYIAKDDIIRLAEIHGLEQSDIQARIDAKKSGQFNRIDQQINLRMGKGYLTEAELSKIARQNSMEPEEIRNRVRCPIVKDEKDVGDLKIRPLDKSIEKAINDNLKIIGKLSLYDFLGTAENSGLDILQEKAGKKKKDLAASAKKDAVVTASNTLAGHCLTIFKNNDTRIAYDVSLAMAKLAALDSDINVAAANKKIRHEYVDLLIRKAMSFGMDRQEATDYLRDYCLKKKYRIEIKPEKKRMVLIGAATAVVVAVVLIFGVVMFSSIHKKNSLIAEYDLLIKTVDTQTDLEKKIQILEKYIKTHAPGELVTDAGKRVSGLQRDISEDRFNRMLKEADALLKATDYRSALVLYNKELASTTDAGDQKTIKDLIQKTLALSEQKDFEQVTAVSLNGEPDQKMNLFQQYLVDHPNGKNIDKVKGLINEISGEYFIFVNKQMEAFDQSEKWEESYNLCRAYIGIYDNSNADRLKQLMPHYEERIRDEKILTGLIQKADALGTDYASALQVFKDFLMAYPDTTVNEKIQKEIARLNTLLSAQSLEKAAQDMRIHLAKTGGRFVERANGVVVDTRTGLMWEMMDSSITQTSQCLTYDEGKKYIKDLRAGGFTDWRLPTPDELTGIYMIAPVFPSTGAKSYWTSVNFTGYSDGWHVMVDTVSSDDSVHWETVKKDSLECGAVRAVRKP
ncbi:MAG: DUF1566 domain-containing protein [Desulfobacteraceae bacterium]|nr:MAG: DUF1566 domain-containing protein [Desulfobacteraceae bacterium]